MNVPFWRILSSNNGGDRIHLMPKSKDLTENYYNIFFYPFVVERYMQGVVRQNIKKF